MKKIILGVALMGILYSQTPQDSVYFSKGGELHRLTTLYLIPGESVNIDLKFKTGSNVGGVIIPLWFSTNYLSLVSYTGNNSSFPEADTSYFLFENALVFSPDTQKLIFALIQGKNTITTGSYTIGTFRVRAVGPVGANVTSVVNPVFWAPASQLRFINTQGTTDWSPNFSSFNLRIIPCGDVNGDGSLSQDDAIYIINYLFFLGSSPVSVRSGDVNNDGALTADDSNYITNYLFYFGPAPNCGVGGVVSFEKEGKLMRLNESPGRGLKK